MEISITYKMGVRQKNPWRDRRFQIKPAMQLQLYKAGALTLCPTASLLKNLKNWHDNFVSFEFFCTFENLIWN